MTPDFVIKAGDTLPILRAILKIGNDPMTDLASVTDVKLTLVKRSDPSTFVFVGTAVIVDTDTAEVNYIWSSTDTATIGVGIYNAQWHLTYSDGGKRSLPTVGSFIVSIENKHPESA